MVDFPAVSGTFYQLAIYRQSASKTPPAKGKKMTQSLIKPTIHFVVLILYLGVWPYTGWAGDDFIIILDQSASMRESQPGNPGDYQTDPLLATKSSEAVKAINDVISQLIKIDDYFALIIFGDTADILISQHICYPHEREVLQRQITLLPFKDKKTDIFASIKTTQDLLEALKTPQRRKILVLITDGRNDPPILSPFQLPQKQDDVFRKFRHAITRHSWNVNLVGLGLETDIDRIASGLGLSEEQVLTLDDLHRGEIETRLRSLFEQQQRVTITLNGKDIHLRLAPKLLGGYKTAQVEMTLISTYPEKTRVELTPKTPLVFSDSKTLHAAVSPQSLTLAPNQSSKLKLELSYTGQRPESGLIKSLYHFKFLKHSFRFYPWQGRAEVILPSWWESFGRLTSTVIIGFMLLFTLIAWKAKQAQIPQVRILVNSDQGTLGEPLTLKRGQSFYIANGYLEGPVVPAKGLECHIAAEVKYLGRKKFEVIAKEAMIAQINGTREKLVVQMDVPFSLKEKVHSNILHNIILSFPGRSGDIFSNGSDADPF
jgi:hypothetical protein